MTDLIVLDKTPSKAELQKELKNAIKKIDTKLRALMRGGSATPKSPGNFKLNENDSNNINILNCIDVSYLIKALACMNRVKKEYDETAKQEKLESYPVCTWLGVPIDNWIHDLRMRLGVVTNSSLITSLNASRTKLETFLTEEQRLHVTLTEISKLIGGK